MERSPLGLRDREQPRSPFGLRDGERQRSPFGLLGSEQERSPRGLRSGGRENERQRDSSPQFIRAGVRAMEQQLDEEMEEESSQSAGARRSFRAIFANPRLELGAHLFKLPPAKPDQATSDHEEREQREVQPTHVPLLARWLLRAARVAGHHTDTHLSPLLRRHRSRS